MGMIIMILRLYIFRTLIFRFSAKPGRRNRKMNATLVLLNDKVSNHNADTSSFLKSSASQPYGPTTIPYNMML